jgi:hypothetical protein
VIASEQVLVCPTCQQGDWTNDLDRCPGCGSVRLSKALGIVRCSGCGWSAESEPGPAAPRQGDAGGLTGDVAAALDRVLGKLPDPAADR